MRKFGRYLWSLPLKQRIPAVMYLAVIMVAFAGIPLLGLGITSHHQWMVVVGIALMIFLLVENAIISPILRFRASQRKTKPPV